MHRHVQVIAYSLLAFMQAELLLKRSRCPSVQYHGWQKKYTSYTFGICSMVKLGIMTPPCHIYTLCPFNIYLHIPYCIPFSKSCLLSLILTSPDATFGWFNIFTISEILLPVFIPYRERKRILLSCNYRRTILWLRCTGTSVFIWSLYFRCKLCVISAIPCVFLRNDNYDMHYF